MVFDPFVLPFVIGLLILLAILGEKYSRWLRDLTSDEWKQILLGVFSYRIFKAIKEVFLECLLHRRIFKQNILLGWMHMSFALGWFLLIVAGAMESKNYTHFAIKPPYFPIFFKFFVHNKLEIKSQEFFVFAMDFLLVIILSGLVLAFIKRLSSRGFGMKKTTKFGFGNRLTILSLWLIFPLRLLAESLTSAKYNNGGFLTGSLGHHIPLFLHNSHLEYTAWWAYSFSLGTFFVCIPFSRYMHIPTEVLLIFLRNFGIKSRKVFDGFSRIEVNSCPRCGLCIDKCPLNKHFDNEKTVPSYYLKSIRDKKVNEQITFDCLMCGRCKEYCPVGIDIIAQRSLQRSRFISNGNSMDFLQDMTYFKNMSCLSIGSRQNAPVAYFAGCMTHLTPSIKYSVIKLLKAAGKNFTFIDPEGGACCGRPQILAGNYDLADKLIKFNKEAIKQSGAKILLVSCPICYKVFKNEYKLEIEVLHHSEYFARLVDTEQLKIKKIFKEENNSNLSTKHYSLSTVTYHDPCELGRGEGIYKQPRRILKNIADLKSIKCERGKSLCCGGSLGAFEINENKRNIIRNDALKILTAPNPDYIVTACPLCKKTFSNGTVIPVKDIAEMLVMSLKEQNIPEYESIIEFK